MNIFKTKQYSNCLNNYGVAQSIALKEFSEYLSLDPSLRYSETGDKLFNIGCELLKLHTQQYAKRQRNWVNQRLLRRANCREVPRLVKLDTSKDFHEKVVPKAAEIVREFLNGDIKGEPCEMPEGFIEGPYQEKSNKIYHCEICEIDVQGTTCWNQHLNGKKHKYAARKHKSHDNLNFNLKNREINI